MIQRQLSLLSNRGLCRTQLTNGVKRAVSSPAVSEDDFRARCEQLGLRADSSAAVALSGGPDSMALLALALSLFKKTYAVIVDHNIRPESKDEAMTVGRWARQMGAIVQNQSLPDWGQESSPNQKQAREARYAAIVQGVQLLTHTEDQEEAKEKIATLNNTLGPPGAFSCRLRLKIPILTAHHADDQIETMILRMSANSGLQGLAGIQAHSLLTVGSNYKAYEVKNDDHSNYKADGRNSVAISVFRPLLDFSKEQLISTCHERGLNYVEDPSNRSTIYKRNYIRKAIQQALKDSLISRDELLHLSSTLSRTSALCNSHLQIRELDFVEFTYQKDNILKILLYPNGILEASVVEQNEIIARALHKFNGYQRAPKRRQIISLVEDLQRLKTKTQSATGTFKTRSVAGCVAKVVQTKNNKQPGASQLLHLIIGK